MERMDYALTFHFGFSPLQLAPEKAENVFQAHFQLTQRSNPTYSSRYMPNSLLMFQKMDVGW